MKNIALEIEEISLFFLNSMSLKDAFCLRQCSSLYKLAERPGFARPSARSYRCPDRVGYKVWQSLVQGMTKSETRCHKLWYKVSQKSDKGVTGSVTRCDRVGYKVGQIGYKVWPSLVQGVTGLGTRCVRVRVRPGPSGSVFGTRSNIVWYKVWQSLPSGSVRARPGPSGSYQIGRVRRFKNY